MNKISLLDCTLRDGGYVNDWRFGIENACGIIQDLNKSGVEFIECGLLGQNTNPDRIMYDSIEQYEDILPELTGNSQYTVMLNYSERNSIKIKQANKIKIIRLAFFKDDCYDALEYAKYLMSLGYDVCMQMMATHMYANQEFVCFIKNCNHAKVFCVTVVDSFGIFYQDDVEQYVSALEFYLDEDIICGFHGHNNLQLANANAMDFIRLFQKWKRKIIVDCTVFGMGRGAGNAQIEVMMKYMNDRHNGDYNIQKAIKIFDKYIQIDDREWGYSLEHFLTAERKINPSYIWFLQYNGISDVDLINAFLLSIPKEFKHILNKELVIKWVRT
jgi:4-hydroxy 2-oxovalerate aldolase